MTLNDSEAETQLKQHEQHESQLRRNDGMVADKIYKHVDDVRREIVMAFNAPAKKGNAQGTYSEHSGAATKDKEPGSTLDIVQLLELESDWASLDAIPDGLTLE